MKLLYLIVILTVLSMWNMAHALERTAALPYDYGRSVNSVYVPKCSPTEYIGVSGTVLNCKAFPTCQTGEYLTNQNGTLECKGMASQSCGDGASLVMSGGTWKCIYTKTCTSGTQSGSNWTVYCNNNHIRTQCVDTGYGQNHGINLVAPNGCSAWEGKNNKGGQNCQITCMEN